MMESIYTWSMLLSITSFAFATAMTPGPNNFMLLSSGLTFGYKKTLAHILGVMVGFPIMILAVGLGMGSVFEMYPVLYDVIKVVGIAYLLWMAWKIATSSSTIRNSDEVKKPFTFFQAVLFQWVNPKAWVMVITVMGSFITSTKHAFLQVFIIAFIYLCIGLLSTNFWALGGVYLQKFISHEKSIKLFNMSMAVLIVLSVVPFILKG
ncbi:MAG: Transporter, LysE family [uncultured Sulfurovum sp.]|uniref:Transporter, LysE family n=1 Tax=uncultured Sulfurovum sp. TaxID=269237 RepID=A0A6S6UH28_9BACT|nr:MAG: Transporter, LysE family [uncultured Sulfurovum sp.]